MPCNNCSACMMNDCGECKFCLDKRKFGGPGKLKKRCELRTCVVPSANPIKPATPAGMKTTAMKTLTIKQKQPEMRNKFLSSIDLDDVGDMNSSFEDSFGGFGGKLSDDSPSPPDQSASSLQSFIYGGLTDTSERYEVVEVIQAEDKPCYICRAFTAEDLFYCSSCYDPYHQLCLQMQHLPQHKGLNGSGSMCGRCLNSKDSYEEDINNKDGDMEDVLDTAEVADRVEDRDTMSGSEVEVVLAATTPPRRNLTRRRYSLQPPSPQPHAGCGLTWTLPLYYDAFKPPSKREVNKWLASYKSTSVFALSPQASSKSPSILTLSPQDSSTLSIELYLSSQQRLCRKNLL